MVSLLAAAAIMVAVGLSEWLHAARVRRVAYLAFGPAGTARAWTKGVPLLRVVASGAITWGLMTLVGIGASPLEDLTSRNPKSLHHLVIALDVSPSMGLVDAGPKENQTRGDRAREVIRSVLDRLDPQRTRVSIVAFYSTAMPVVIDTFDPEVTANVLNDLPLEHAFQNGKTDIYSGVREAAKLSKDWRERSATLLVVSDGDTLPSQEQPTLPRAYASVVVLGVGSPQRGTFIDGHSSRQDAQSLERLALRLGGQYHNANAKHLQTGAILAAVAAVPPEEAAGLDRRWLAVVATAAGSLILALLPLLLALAGTGHRPRSAHELNSAYYLAGQRANHEPRRKLLESGT
ncbi:VWA domain-containing protein [Anatilimnocola sp. NA78]|uniref:vWA domain-containing protein n=1 Tax=Anatilimnocola sp. NA78 TaxID=3415683 RepID=UPI003CE5A61F